MYICVYIHIYIHTYTVTERKQLAVTKKAKTEEFCYVKLKQL